MIKHYDPGYLRSLAQTFVGFDKARMVALADASAQALDEVARALVSA
jgi:hypothetical protein